jgi:steroid delta-isomerase-like uncharacterized protein
MSATLTEEAQAVVERFWDEVWNKRNFAIGDELLPDNVIVHNFGAVVEGREGWRRSMEPFFTGFPDLRFTVEFRVAEGDKVAMRWTATGTHTGVFRGIAPTGKPINIAGAAIYRVSDGQIVEGWSHPDTLGLMLQIGATLAPPNQEARA